jgi:hypothetical protein
MWRSLVQLGTITWPFLATFSILKFSVSLDFRWLLLLMGLMIGLVLLTLLRWSTSE